MSLLPSMDKNQIPRWINEIESGKSWRPQDPGFQALRPAGVPKSQGQSKLQRSDLRTSKSHAHPLASSKLRLWQSISSSNSISSNHISISSRTFSQHLQLACTWVLFISFSCSSTVMSTIDGPSPTPMAAMVESRGPLALFIASTRTQVCSKSKQVC